MGTSMLFVKKQARRSQLVESKRESGEEREDELETIGEASFRKGVLVSFSTGDVGEGEEDVDDAGVLSNLR